MGTARPRQLEPAALAVAEEGTTEETVEEAEVAAVAAPFRGLTRGEAEIGWAATELTSSLPLLGHAPFIHSLYDDESVTCWKCSIVMSIICISYPLLNSLTHYRPVMSRYDTLHSFGIRSFDAVIIQFEIYALFS